MPFPNCECVRSFQTCLKKLNTKISNEFSLIYSINTTKCFSNERSIVKCNKHEQSPDTNLLKFSTFAEREKYFKRCILYELDKNQSIKLQLFDVPFSEITGMLMKLFNDTFYLTVFQIYARFI